MITRPGGMVEFFFSRKDRVDGTWIHAGIATLWRVIGPIFQLVLFIVFNHHATPGPTRRRYPTHPPDRTNKGKAQRAGTCEQIERPTPSVRPTSKQFEFISRRLPSSGRRAYTLLSYLDAVVKPYGTLRGK